MTRAENAICDYCGYLLPNHEERCFYNPVNLKPMTILQKKHFDAICNSNQMDSPEIIAAKESADITIEFAKGLLEFYIDYKKPDRLYLTTDELINEYINQSK